MGEKKLKPKKMLLHVVNDLGMLLVLAFMMIVLAIVAPNFFTSRNLLNIFRQISFVAIVAFGEAAVIMSGGIDLSVGSIIGVATMITAHFALPGEYPLVVTILAGLLTGAFIGFLNGLMVAKLRLPPFIATLGTMTSCIGVSMWITEGRAITGLKEEFNFIGYGNFLGIPISVWILIFVVIITHFLLKKTKFGRHIFAIGGNEQAAIFSGINIDLEKIKVYTFSGLLAGLSAVLLTARVASGQPAAGEGYELDAIAAAVIGGTSITGGVGSALGVFTGALIIGVINNGMMLLNINVYMQQFVRGLIIIAAVTVDSFRRKV